MIFDYLLTFSIFRIQDICILFAVIVVFLLFFNTYIFQAGLVAILINKFKATIIVVFIYFSLCVSLHIWGMVRACVCYSIQIYLLHL